MLLDPRIAHVVDARVLLRLLPQLAPSDLAEIRIGFAHFLDPFPRRREYATWQQAWNAWTGATEQRPGSITYTPARCPDCDGRGFDHRHPGHNLARTGHPAVCGRCFGSRPRTAVTQTALHAATGA